MNRCSTSSIGGNFSLFSVAYRFKTRPSCLRLFTQALRLADSLAFASAGSRMAARIPIMAMTTSSSTRVKPLGPKHLSFIHNSPLWVCASRLLPVWCQECPRADFVKLAIMCGDDPVKKREERYKQQTTLRFVAGGHNIPPFGFRKPGRRGRYVRAPGYANGRRPNPP